MGAFWGEGIDDDGGGDFETAKPAAESDEVSDFFVFEREQRGFDIGLGLGEFGADGVPFFAGDFFEDALGVSGDWFADTEAFGEFE